MARGLLVAALAAMTAAAPATAAPPLEPGVSRSLAERRAKHYSNVGYRLQIAITDAADALEGELELRVTVRGAPADVVLDWRPPPGGTVRDVAVNGKPIDRPRTVREHLVIPARAVRRGENAIALRFGAPIATAGTAVTRYEDREDGAAYVYSLLVPAEASTVFPCFDQPDLKARFALVLETPARWEAVSNAPAIGADVRAGRKRTEFRATEPISTYLFAFAAGPFAVIEDGDGEGGLLKPESRLYVRASRLERARREAHEVFGLHRRGLEFFAEWFGFSFPFPKHDLVLVPEFPYGGMEHAGATFLREEAVLFPTAPSGTDRLRRAQLLFHETSHQWFGDLVTMRWFDDLWLKEGFANFMAAKATEALLPEMSAWTAFQQLKATAYRTDATRGTTPISRPLPNLSAAKSQYGSIVYGKAPAVLRQAEFYLGADAFRRAVQALVHERAYGVADWNEVVRAFERASGRDLAGWADAWVKRRGMPTVRADWRAGPDGRIARFALTQADALRGGTVWPMRVELALAWDGAAPETLAVELDGGRVEIAALVGRPAPRFVFANHGDFGYGRFPLDDASRAAVLAEVGAVGDAGLRALLLDALWDEVRDARLAPVDYIGVALERIPAERDEVLVASLLARTQHALRTYLSDAQRTALAPRIERVLADGMHGAPGAGLRIQHFRAYAAVAATDEGRRTLKALMAGKETLPDVPLRARDRFRIVERLLAVGDADGAGLLAAESAADRSDDARRYAFAAGAAAGHAATKAHYFASFLDGPALAESWVEAALGPFNAVEQAALTAPYLGRALAALPRLKRERKIFFVNHWLAAFLGGQTAPESAATVARFLERAKLDGDLRLKVLEAADDLERTVRIRARFGRE
jgi:aminopeptidase N